MKNRKIKLIYILALVFSITAMSIGFAAFSSSLNLVGDATVKPNLTDFRVKFSTDINSVVEGDVVPNNISSGITAEDGVIDNTSSPRLTNLSVFFTSPGQYVEYSFYAYNDGEYDAYLNSVNFDGKNLCIGATGTSKDLLNAACEAINMSITVDGETYTESTPITNHILTRKTGEQIKLRIEYDSDGEAVDGDFKVEHPDVVLIYSTINDSTFIPEDSELTKLKLLDAIKENAVLDTDVDFTSAPTAGTYLRRGTENDSNPIYYYRGAVTNNNLKFAGFCWNIVRTTETGGIKLIYNGVPAENGSCNNRGEARQLANTSAFSLNYDSLADVGYMYGIRYTTAYRDLSNQTDTYIYGNDVKWDGSKYTLVDTISSSSWSEDRTNLAKRYHYTCFSTATTCTDVQYIYYFGDSTTSYYLNLVGGKNIEEAKEEMFTNTTDSTIKTVIDNWYSTNMVAYTSKLEDTVWCNERNFYNGSLKSKDTDAGEEFFWFSAVGQAIERNLAPSLSCPNTRDSFTVDGVIGNGKLTYPVGLLTLDEIAMAGISTDDDINSYIIIGQDWWSFTPYSFVSGNAIFLYLDPSGVLSEDSVSNENGVRPSVSLKSGTRISGGTGSVEDPYIIK